MILCVHSSVLSEFCKAHYYSKTSTIMCVLENYFIIFFNKFRDLSRKRIISLVSGYSCFVLNHQKHYLGPDIPESLAF